MLGRLIAWISLFCLVLAKDSHSTACAFLSGLSLHDPTGVVTIATPIFAGSNFTGNGSEPSYNIPQIDLPALCRIAFTIETSSNSSAVAEIWLPPASTWNGRFLAVGNGGFAGGVNYPDIVWGARKGFACMSTNTGHNGNQLDPTVFLNNPEVMIDWGHRALHLTTVAAKEIVSEFYGDAAKHYYYAGCSTGGRQGLNAIQRYPDDYDGALVSSAIPWQTHTAEWQTYVALEQFPNNRSSFIPANMWNTIHAAVLNQCDAIDGVKDGVIMDPSKCSFHPEVLLCGKPNTTSACLNGDQIVNLKRMYAPWLADDGTLVNPGISPSGETSFTILMNGVIPTFGPGFMQNMVFNDSNWDWRTQNVSDVVFADSVNPGGCNAYNPDMRPFKEQGSKVLQYHGYSDPLVPSLNAPAFYDLVSAFFESVGEAAEVEDFYRLFMVPGMGHCSGGVGAWALDGASQGGIEPGGTGSDFSMLWSLVSWVEGKEEAPEMVIGTKYVNDIVSDGIQFQRPVCRWPTVAEYHGGNANSWESWVCPGIGVY